MRSRRVQRRIAPTTNVNARQVWRDLTAAARALSELDGVGVVTRLTELRRAAAGAAFPIAGEDAKAASNGFLEYVRTLSQSGEDRRGWHVKALQAIGEHLGALLDQDDFAAAGRGRRMCGDD